MVQDLVSVTVFSLIDLLKGSFISSVPVFIFVFFASKVRRAIAGKYKWSWFKSGFITTYLLIFSLILVLYLQPALPLLQSDPFGETPVEFQTPVLELLLIALIQLVRLLVVALVLSFIVLPLEFIGLFLHEKIKKSFKFHWALKLYLTVFIVTLLASIFVLFFAQWIISGTLAFIYYWPEI
ncbi:MAG: hypothetical protein J4224_01585 [Candidatus Diapherotrites archaeon]|uniref:Uncharacterized protein n=1 Tax=Candidatus Iainarchaeum sp. TaxID=3101447 RepID=A0A7J4IWE5_9ARCH|nr:MAG: hypothetical protein QT03_C0001G0716 [archaeon GW2011_AR10]MBS3059097.1 hypothetical protein [Candidatus Diapherotrites archaeon]HIH08057.1 hypothetical protein [Candidatus Diapherotrites archaeon]